MTQPVVFSVDDANKRLCYVQTIVRDIVTLANDLQQPWGATPRDS